MLRRKTNLIFNKHLKLTFTFRIIIVIKDQIRHHVSFLVPVAGSNLLNVN